MGRGRDHDLITSPILVSFLLRILTNLAMGSRGEDLVWKRDLDGCRR